MKTAFALATALLAIDLHANDWPQFRGPGAQGHANAKLPVDISATSDHLKWKVPVPGNGWSSPVIVNGKIFLTSAIEQGEGLSLNALCLNADDGKLLWNTPIFAIASAPRMHRKNSQASPTPIVDTQRVYVHFGHLGTAALSLDGKVAWKNDAIKYPPVHGNGGTPALVDKKLIFSCDGARDPFVIALNTKDGSQAWKVNRSIDAKRKFSFSTPLELQTNTGTQVLLPGSDMIGAYDPANGKEIWRATYDGYSVVPRPVIGHGMVFFSTGFDRAKTMAVELGGKGDVTETHVKWILPKGAPHTPSMILTGNELFMVSDGGIASCVDAKSGEVHWSERLGGGCSASPILANGKLYQVNEAGTVYVLEAGKEFKLLSKKSLGERSLASPAVAHGALYIRTTDHLWRFE